MKNLPLQQIARALEVNASSNPQVTGYQIDSRLVQPGELFFALPGERVDGHDYLKQVKERGGVAAIVLDRYEGPDFGLVLLRVEDVVASLQGLARHFMKECKAIRIGVTGSLGKTTVKEFLATLLSRKFKVGKTPLNYNTKLTYPLTLLNLEGGEEVLVLEMGMSEPGDLKKLVEIAAPDLAIVTKIALVHAAFFPRGLVDIAIGKADIFSDPRTKICLFDHDLYQYPEAIEKIQGEKISFSHPMAGYFLSPECFVDEKGVRVYRFDPPYKQAHILHNFLAAVGMARQLGLSWDEINDQVPFLRLPKMRFEQFERRGVVFINDAYNANPDSMRAALASLPEPKEGGKRIAVLGRMVDLGPTSAELHFQVGQFARGRVDHLLIFGEEAKKIGEGFERGEHFFTFEDLAKRVKTLMSPGDVVLVKASRAAQMETLFQLL